MTTDTFQDRVETTGRFIFDKIEGEKPSIFKKSWWQEKVLNWSMKNPKFKTQLFYFVDVFPTLKKDAQVIQHIREYFTGEDQDVASFLKLCAGTAGFSSITAKLAAKVIKSNIENMAKQFIVGQSPLEAVKQLTAMRKKQQFAFTADILGEVVLSEKESISYGNKYIELLQILAHAAKDWEEDILIDNSEYGPRPRVNISVKTSALYSQYDPLNHEGTINNVLEKLRPILRQAKALNCAVTLDAENYEYKAVNQELFKQVLMEDEFKDMDNVGIVIQAYLHDAEKDLQDLLAWVAKRGAPINIRLVKGAYWDYEVMNAQQKGWPCPVFTLKPETDANYERLTRFLFEHRQQLRPAFGTHNIRNIAFVIELAKDMHVPANGYEFQMLYGMAEPFKSVLVDMGYCVRNYAPIGELIPGMAYLVRRLLENTANEGFLRQSFVDEKDYAELLQNPLDKVPPHEKPVYQRQTEPEPLADFDNEPLLDFNRPEIREKFGATIKATKDKYYGRKYGLVIHGREVSSDEWHKSINPSHPDEIVGNVAMASLDDAKHAIESAKQTFNEWSETTPEQRANYLFEIAAIMRRRKFELAALEVCEAGKNWREADADVAEAIDFCEYYGREMLRLGKTQKMGETIGELNHYFYQPKGVGVVIGPWNFPLAIPVGMAMAAIVTGNTVVLKPAQDTPVILANFMQVLKEAKLPAGVVNFLPGSGAIIGDYLIDHPDVKFITFTGSMEVGLRILERAGKINSGQTAVKSVIAEMGGKNAIIIDEDADLDSAIKGVIHSAFGFQGQKCSAASRIIVLENIYPEFIERFSEAIKDITMGSAEDPEAKVGPVISKKRQEEILRYIEIGKKEANLLIQKEFNGEGFYVPITVFSNVEPHHVIAQEEIFGPVAAVIKAGNFDEALEIANGTKFALTGGVYSRSPENIKKACKKFNVGNLYINRQITGALVYRQPFGGFNMSGVGSKAGGPDYLIRFMEPRSITENTFRSGFAPGEN